LFPTVPPLVLRIFPCGPRAPVTVCICPAYRAYCNRPASWLSSHAWGDSRGDESVLCLASTSARQHRLCLRHRQVGSASSGLRSGVLCTPLFTPPLSLFFISLSSQRPPLALPRELLLSRKAVQSRPHRRRSGSIL
ncbi:unnamed protein product, partial [Ectocarpus sp. 12 AP-2014]